MVAFSGIHLIQARSMAPPGTTPQSIIEVGYTAVPLILRPMSGPKPSRGPHMYLLSPELSGEGRWGG